MSDAERRLRARQRKRRQRERERADRWPIVVPVPGNLLADIASVARINAREMKTDYIGQVIGDLLALWYERDQSQRDTKGSIHRVMSSHGPEKSEDSCQQSLNKRTTA